VGQPVPTDMPRYVPRGRGGWGGERGREWYHDTEGWEVLRGEPGCRGRERTGFLSSCPSPLVIACLQFPFSTARQITAFRLPLFCPSYPYTGNFFVDGSASGIRQLANVVSRPTVTAVSSFLRKARWLSLPHPAPSIATPTALRYPLPLPSLPPFSSISLSISLSLSLSLSLIYLNIYVYLYPFPPHNISDTIEN
jgi:hypothetical protein